MGRISNREKAVKLMMSLNRTKIPEKRMKVRNELFSTLYRISCWLAQHFKIDGYLESDDLNQEGAILLLEAIDDAAEKRLDPNRIVKEAYYHVYYGLQRIFYTKRSILSGDTYNNTMRFRKHYRSFCKDNIDWIGYDDYLSIDEDADHVLPSYTIDRDTYTEDLLYTFQPDVDVITGKDFLMKCLKACGCNDRQLLMLDMYYYQERDVEYIAWYFDITRERVRQVLSKAMEKAYKNYKMVASEYKFETFYQNYNNDSYRIIRQGTSAGSAE